MKAINSRSEIRIFKKFSDYQTVTYNIAGQEVSAVVAADLKIYGGNTVYINKKKTTITPEDVDTIERAEAEMFITKALNKTEDYKIYYKDGAFQFKERALGFYYEIKKEEDVRSVLLSLNFQIVNL